MKMAEVKLSVAMLAVLLALTPVAVFCDVVFCKDASKIKSWDARGKHKKPSAPKECDCVTWRMLNSLDPGIKEIGRLAVRGAKKLK